MGSIGWSEMLIIFLVLLLLFGAKRLPELARGLGKSIREFKKATSEIGDELDLNRTINPPGQAATPPASAMGNDTKKTNTENTTTEKEG